MNAQKTAPDYEMVVGLEVHVELKTRTKIFCSCPTDFGAAPNTQCCPVCMGMPGTLPVLNRRVVEYAVKAGLATNCKIASYSKQDRKNYFYPDLPKAYQISQFDLPLCEGGWLDIEGEGESKRVGITRIHIEEDAGKLIHDEKEGTLIDCNRCGVPLIEIVTEPDLRSAEEVKAFLTKLRAIILYTGISDVKMNEGSLRCDVNLSVRKYGCEKLGTRTEMKNLNSFSFITKAIGYEYRRQVEELESGVAIIQETRRFDETTGKTYSMRRKEESSDYRYFPDPDLPPIRLDGAKIAALREDIPTLPDERKKKYVEDYSLTPYIAEMLTLDAAVAELFDKTAPECRYPKLLAGILVSSAETAVKLTSKSLADVADMAGDGAINSGTVKKLLAELEKGDFDVKAYVAANGLAQISDRATLEGFVRETIAADPKSVESYKKGKTSAAKAIIGKVMAKTGGRGNAALIGEITEKLLRG